MMRHVVAFALFALTLASAPPHALAAAEPGSSSADNPGADLPYPMAQAPQPGEIIHVPTGLDMSFAQMMDTVAGARLVFIGEAHDNLRAHDVELQVIRELERRFPGRVAIGMEMFRQPQQAVLDRWSQGQLGELELLEATQWQRTWGFDFRYYRAILDFAREKHLDVVALRPSAQLEDAVRAHGIEGLPAGLKAELPDIGPPDRYEQAVMQAIYGAHLRTGSAFDAFFRVQRLWEESMAAAAVSYLKSARGAGKILVTLTGAGHVEDGFGLPKKVIRRLPLPYVIVTPREISVPPDKQMPPVKMPEIPLLPADFVWWVPYESLDASAVHLGVMIDESGGGMVIRTVNKDSPAEKAGLLAGDAIVAFDGHPVPDVTGLAYWLGRLEKGSSATVTVRRGGKPLEVRVAF